MLCFSNPGLIDLRAVTTMGVSVKDGTNPIGYFGTGLKYAIATILRNGGKVTIWRGLDRFEFGVQQDTIRGKDFSIVTMNSQALGFTTELGRNWEPWMAFRELYSNMLDEAGTMTREVTPPAPRNDWTRIYVQCAGVEKAANEIWKYFIQSKPRYVEDGVEFHTGKFRKEIFYRGVQAGAFDKPAQFDYNITGDLTLTEDRTLKNIYEAQSMVAKAIASSSNAELIREFITTVPHSWEHSLDIGYWTYGRPSDTFIAVAADCFRRSPTINKSIVSILAKYAPEVSHKTCELLPTEREQLNAAIKVCRDLGYEVDEYPIKIAVSLGKGVLGKANMEKNEIWLARDAISAEAQSLIGTLIEEWAHLRFGYADESRELQNWLLNNLVRLGRAYLATKK
jgi:hypothetical protein